MTTVALFHSVLGVRAGVHDAAERLRLDGHTVLVVDQYEGRVFDDYETASAYAEGSLGFPELMRRAVEAVRDLPDGFVAAGFSNGGGMAEHVALQRRCSGVLLLGAAMPVAELGAPAWPAGVPVQVHYTVGDPYREQEWLDGLVAEVRAAGAQIEVFDYPGDGHLFTDPSLLEEHDPEATALVWQRALPFVRACG